MPRGVNPNSLKALNENRHKWDSESALIAKKRSDESKIASASITEAMRNALTPERAMKIAEVVLRKAEAGNLKAYELVRDQMDEKPTEKIAISTVSDESISKLQDAVAKRREENEQIVSE